MVWFIRLFSEKNAFLQTESCTVQSVEVYSQSIVSLPYFQKAQMSCVLSIVKWNGAYYTKNIIIAFKKS